MKDESNEIFKTPGASPNFKSELADQLAILIPEAVVDGKIEIEKLKELLGDDLSDDRERFGLFWPGKKRSLRVAQEPTSATLKPDFANSKDWNTTQNVFIEGDNLEVLKILQKYYHGKIKMIYIDPPYNTGKDFVYADNFKEGIESYLDWSRQVNEEGKRVSTNSELGGRFHSNWLNMMYPRLKLARNLLTEDGVIYISIDDNELDNLLKLCKEVFGEQNHIATIIWKSKAGGANDSGEIAVDHEYIVGFARNNTGSVLGLDPGAVASTSYNLSDEKGKFALRRLDQQNLQYSKSMDYVLTGPDGTKYQLEHKDNERPNAIWRWSKEKVDRDKDQLVFKDGHVYTKFYEQQGGKPRSLFIDERFGRTRTGSTEVRELLKGDYFDNPKPTKLIKTLIAMSTTPQSIILDFFAGSGTTAHAVMALNQEDGGARNWMQIQLPEPTPLDSTARAEGFLTISSLARKRLELAAEEISLQDSNLFSPNEVPQDLGFRAYSLSESHFPKWNVNNEISPILLEQQLLDLRDNNSKNTSAAELLAEIMIKQGYSLTESIGELEISNLKVITIGENTVLAVLDKDIKPSLEQLRKVLEKKPVRFVILEDILAADDELKTNLVQECKSRNIELWTT